MPVLPQYPTHLLGMMRNDLGFKLFDAALEGARTLMTFWCGMNASTTKADGSLVSEADHAADVTVRTSLAKLGIETALVSEETLSVGDMGHETFLLLDPLDGTSEFLDHGEEFCVCLAAIHRGRAIAGAIVAPALRRGWYSGEMSFSVTLDDMLLPVGEPGRIHVSDRVQPAEPRALVSRRNGDPRSVAALQRCGVSSMVPASSAIKFGMLAEGRADVHVRHGQTMAWDIAAGDAILTAAGGFVRAIDGTPLTYSGSDHSFRNPAFVAVSHANLLNPLLNAVQRAS